MSAAFALLSCFSAWQAWRHNPLYAPQSGRWLMAKLLLMLVGAGALIAATTMLTADRPESVQVGALVLCVLICTLGLVFGISAVTTPRIAHLQTHLPAAIHIVRLHRQRVTHWLRIALAYFAACGLLALVGEPVRSFAMVLATLGVLICAVMLPVGYAMARRMDRAVTALELYPWLHWQYPPELRDVWCRAQVERLKRQPPAFILRRDWLKLLGLCALLVIPSVALMSGSWIERVGWSLFCCVLLGLFIELAATEQRRAPAKLARRLKAAPADVWFGRDGLVCDGHFYTWVDTSVYLTSAHIDWRPPRSVCFEFANISSSAYGAATTGSITQNVLIPPIGAGADLASLQQQLRARCPNAEIKLA
jgi:hypothetical protein